MGVYKVLKDFPSRNGVTQYKAGQTIQLDENSRTKALVEMEYVRKVEYGSQTASNNKLAVRICDAVSKIDGVGDVTVTEASYVKSYRVFWVKIEERQ